MEAMQSGGQPSVLKKNNRKKRRVIGFVLAGLAVAAIVIGSVILVRGIQDAGQSDSVLSYRIDSVSQGEISSVISGSGTLSALRSSTAAAPAAAVVEEVYKQPGDTAAAGETIVVLSCDSVESQIDELSDQLEELRGAIAETDQTASSLSVTAPAAGRIKRLSVAEGDLAEEHDYLCLISTDNRLKLVIDAPEGLVKYDSVSVSVDGNAEAGLVTDISGGKATIVIQNNLYDLDTAAEVYSEDGELLGSGLLDINEYVAVTAAAGRIATVAVSENQKVSKAKTLFRLKAGAPSADYLDYKQEEQELLDQIADLKGSLVIQAEWDCLVTSLPVEAGDEIASGATVCILSGSDGYAMSLSIDELDIASVQLGQDVTVTLDAIEGSFTGTVSDISYAGSGSYVTSYTATIETEPIPGAYPGMSASVEIITQTSGLTTVVSVNAVQYDGSNAYLYLAGEDGVLGQTAAADTLELDGLTKLSVTTGMSDGSYIVVSGSLESGDLIWVPQLDTTSVYTESEDTYTSFSMGGGMTSSGSMGGMPSGSDMGGMPSGDFSGGMPSGAGGQPSGN